MKLFSLMGLLLLLAVGGCNPSPTATYSPAGPGESSALQVITVSADFAVGSPRVSFALFDGPDPAANVASVTLHALALDEDLSATAALPVWSGPAENYADYEVPYWVFYPELAEPGYWGFAADITRDDGTTTRADFLLEIQPNAQSVAVGAEAPRSENLTLATQPEITLLTSANDPEPELYRLTVAEAVGNGKPTVVGFLTPGFCQTKWCAPVLDTLETVRAEVGDAANFIHVEVYDDFQTLSVVPQMAEWGLETEPWVFVLDADGRVTAKFSGPLSARELRAALGRLLG